MIYPYGTDVRVQHWPYATVAMIGLCVIVFLAGRVDPKVVGALALEIGSGVHPHQWLTATLVNDEVGELAWNALLLWTFGLVVEGKLGWLRSLAVYLGIGTVQCTLVQVLFLAAKPGHVSATSGILFGMMAMSVIWAPENHVLFVHPWWFINRFGIRISRIVVVVFGVQVGIAIAIKAILANSVLNLLGAAAGFGVAIWLLKSRRVACDRCDIFSLRAGAHTMSEARRREQEELNDPEYLRRRESLNEGRRQEFLRKIRTLLRDGHPAVAWAAYQRMAKDQAELVLPEDDLFALIAAFQKQELWTDSIPAMVEYLGRYRDRTVLIRIRLGMALVADNRPKQALRVLAKIDPAALSDDNRTAVDTLRVRAEELRAQEPYEVADEDW
jgi:membrane associated rhomboid family serine protease